MWPQQSAHFRFRNGGPLAPSAFVGELIFATSDAYVAPCSVTETYGILTSGRPIRNRKLTRAKTNNRRSKETIMLDVAFVALGLAALALMGFYALALRQL